MNSKAILTGLVLSVAVQACGSSNANGPGPTVVAPPTLSPNTAGPTAASPTTTTPSGLGGLQPSAMAPPATSPTPSTMPSPTTSPAVGSAGAPVVMGGMAGSGATPPPASGALVAPETGKGVQINTTTFILMPGEELYKCYHAVVPVDGELDVSSFESQMEEGSHHFILYKNDGDTSPDGTLDSIGCTLGFGQNWVFSAAQPHNLLKMPEGVAMTLGSRQQLVFDMHYINVTQKPLTVHVALNINLAQGTFQKASSLVSFNAGIFIPPNGTQTVTGTCTPGAGAKFFLMTTHTHKRGTLATITRTDASGQLGAELVRTMNWDDPTIEHFDPTFVTFQPGEGFQYSCSYQNDRDSTVTVGTSAEANEMCMAITYYFPASAGGSCN